MTTPLAEWFATDIDLRHNQLLNARAENADLPPDNPVKGQFWFDTSTNSLKYWDGGKWAGGRVFYHTVADEGAAVPQRSKLNFRSSTSLTTQVSDSAGQDQTSILVSANFGPTVVAEQSPGMASKVGTASTLARSDHTHGTPPASGASVVMTSWWLHDKELWEELTPTATFSADLSGETVGGGWTITRPGQISWNGDPIPVTGRNVYRNSMRVSSVNAQAQVSMGWRCYDADKNALGRVMCANAVTLTKGTEADQLIARNYMTEPSAEKAFGTPIGETWHSNAAFGSGAIATLSRSSEQAHSGSFSVKAVWANFAAGNTQSNAFCVSEYLPPNTKVTTSGWVYVPSGSPDVRIDTLFYGATPTTSVKDKWVYLEKQWTTPATRSRFYIGFSTVIDGQAGKVAYGDDFMLRLGWGPLPGGVTYFDGDTPDTQTAVYAWDGDMQDSTSAWYTVDPDWEMVVGYIAVGGGAEPVSGTAAASEAAVEPLPGTVFFQPFIECNSDTMLVDTHELSRSTRELEVVDGVHAGWVEVDNTLQATTVQTASVIPPDTGTTSQVRVGPVVDPPLSDGDAVSKAFVDRAVGSTTPPAPQFLWSGSDPTPADLGFNFAAWPLFSMWLDANVTQAKPMALCGTWQGPTTVNCPGIGATWAQVPNCYGVVFTPPADGIAVGISTGSVLASYNDYLELQCRVLAGVNADGDGGTVPLTSSISQQILSTELHDSAVAPPAASSRLGYCLPTIASVTAGTGYKFATFYSNGGPNSLVTRDRVFVLYLPNWGYRG